MPRLACWSCGRQIYTPTPLATLFPEERRCPRCGASLHDDRRDADRRLMHRRGNLPDDPGPPPSVEGEPADERRVADRRTVRRRGGGTPPTSSKPRGDGGWVV
jgi:hypothetical protein